MAVAVDVGATLAKLVVRSADGHLGFRLVSSHAIEQAAREVEQLLPDRLGLTGGGAPEFAQLLGFNDCEVSVYNAFATDPESLMNLLNPVFIDTLTYPETTLVLPMPDSTFPDTSLYTIRLLSLNEVEVSGGSLTSIASTISTGFRAFFKKPPFPF